VRPAAAAPAPRAGPPLGRFEVLEVREGG
jgi:hypothetical protein